MLNTKFITNKNWKHGKLFIQDIGHIRARGRARQGGTVKTSQVKYWHSEWWLSLTIECEPLRSCRQQRAGGLDWGVEYLVSVTDDDGTVHQIDNPRYYKNSKNTLLPLEQRLSRKKKGSQRWRRACKSVLQAKAKIARQRADAQHKLSKNIAENYALIATEKLTIKNIIRSAKGSEETPGKNVAQKSGLNREILDTAPAQLLVMVRYKVEETGGEFIEVPTRRLKPSQRCPGCWAVKRKALSDRYHTCACGCSMPRGAASGWVMVKWALGLGQELARAGNSAKPLLSAA